ncbi:phosphatase PAP2 family protein [Candidatus Kaiserbacteria bacterium]|nr:phosphatase PAP2 family protein [Candidatus Kaiserbacteria bacterium]
MAWDYTLFFALNGLAGHSAVLDAIVIFFASILQYFLVAAFLWLLFRQTKRGKLLFGWTMAIAIVVMRYGVIEAIRYFMHRPRPFLILSSHTLLSDGWFYADSSWSFPSSHAAIFFALAMVVYLHNKKWGAAFFVAAVLMGISRIVAGVHYPSDVIVGAGLGIVMALLAHYFVVDRIHFSRAR